MAVVSGTWNAQEQQLAALTLVREAVVALDADLLLDDERAGLDIDQEGSLPEELRRVHDAARLPRPGGSLGGDSILVRRALVCRLVDPSDDERRAAPLQVVRPDPSRGAGPERVLVVAARVLLPQQQVIRRLDVVRLVDQVERPGAGGAARVTVDQDREAGHLLRILAVEDHLEDPAVRPG